MTMSVERYATIYESDFLWYFYVRDDGIAEPRAQELRKSTLKRSVNSVDLQDFKQEIDKLRKEYNYAFDDLGVEVFFNDLSRLYFKYYDDTLWVTLKLRTQR